jgi:hypothetical protein
VLGKRRPKSAVVLSLRRLKTACLNKKPRQQRDKGLEGKMRGELATIFPPHLFFILLKGEKKLR